MSIIGIYLIIHVHVDYQDHHVNFSGQGVKKIYISVFQMSIISTYYLYYKLQYLNRHFAHSWFDYNIIIICFYKSYFPYDMQLYCTRSIKSNRKDIELDDWLIFGV